MGKTISTHNGSVANRDHNIRNPFATDKQGHIDKSLQGQNEILLDEKPREAYRRIFGQALEDYNAKQERSDRKIKDYYTHVLKDDKKHAVYEMIVQIGDRKDTGVHAPEERAVIKEFITGWKERNPNLELIGAYLHADEHEGTLHAHLDYVPVAHGYARGLSVQNGLVKALKEQGYEKQGKETAQIQWQRAENKTLEEICKAHGIEVEHPTTESRKHLETDLYKLQASVREKEGSLAYLEVTSRMVENTLHNDRRAVNILEEQKNVLEGQIRSLEDDMKVLDTNVKALRQESEQLEGKVLTRREVLQVKIKKPILGNSRSVIEMPYEDAVNLKMTAQKVDMIVERERELTGRMEKERAEVEQLRRQANAMLEKAREIDLRELQNKNSLEERVKKAERTLLIMDKALGNLPEDIKNTVLSECGKVQQALTPKPPTRGRSR